MMHDPKDLVTVVEVSDLLREFGVIGTTDDGSTGTPTARLNAICQSDRGSEFTKRLFSGEISVDERFFSIISELRHWLGHDADADGAVGRVWAIAFTIIEQEQQQAILKSLINAETPDFFVSLRCLATVFEQHRFSTQFLATWLTDLRRRIGGDLAQDGFWSAVSEICSDRERCSELIDTLAERMNPTKQEIIAFIVGWLRSQGRSEVGNQDVELLETRFAESTVPGLRSAYHWSWVTTAFERGLTKPELEELLSRMRDSPECADEIVSVISRLILSTKNSNCVREAAIQAISKSLQAVTSSGTKSNLAFVAARLASGGGKNFPAPVIRDGWILGIQPVAASDVTIWGDIEDFLGYQLKQDQDAFNRTFRSLAEANPDELKKAMETPNLFEGLVRKMKQTDVNGLVGSLAMSQRGPMRKLGLMLFERLELEELPIESLESKGVLEAQLLFYEMQRSMVGPVSRARLLVSLLPHLAEGGEALQEALRDELELQTKNFPGSFRAELSRGGGDNNLVQEVLENAAQYHEELDRIRQSGFCAMQVPGRQRGAALYRSRMAQDAAEHAKRHSLILQMARQVNLPYGRMSSTYLNGHLGEPKSFQEFSSTVEVPIVEFFAPEKMAMRRIHASIAISQLSPDDEGEPADNGQR